MKLRAELDAMKAKVAKKDELMNKSLQSRLKRPKRSKGESGTACTTTHATKTATSSRANPKGGGSGCKDISTRAMNPSNACTPTGHSQTNGRTSNAREAVSTPSPQPTASSQPMDDEVRSQPSSHSQSRPAAASSGKYRTPSGGCEREWTPGSVPHAAHSHPPRAARALTVRVEPISSNLGHDSGAMVEQSGATCRQQRPNCEQEPRASATIRC